MLTYLKRALGFTEEERRDRMEHPDPTPVEVTPNLLRPISSLDDMRRMMAQISAEAAASGMESFEEFYDFGEDSGFEDIPAPAEMKAEAVQMARDRDFEGEVIKAKDEYKKRINAEARDALLKEFKSKKGVVEEVEED